MIQEWGPLERALYLRTLPELAGLSADDLGIVAQSARIRRFPAGTVLIDPAAPPHAIHAIAKGTVLVHGRGYRGDRIGPGRGVGMLSLLARSAGLTATAETEVETLEFEADTVLDSYEDHFNLLYHQIRNLARRTLAARRRLTPRSPLKSWPEPPDYGDRDLDLVERLVVIRRASPLPRNSLTAMAEIARLMEEHHFAPGDYLWREGDNSGHLLTIVSGTVRCVPSHGAPAFQCGPGYPLGDTESLSGEPRWFDAVAETATIVLRGDTETYLDVLEDHFEMAADFLAAMASDLLDLLEAEHASREKS